MNEGKEVLEYVVYADFGYGLIFLTYFTYIRQLP